MKKVTLKITSFILVIICCLSTATIGMVSVSAKTEEEKAKEIAIEVINKYAENLAGVVGKVPYVGDICKIVFNYIAKGILPQAEKADPFKDLNDKLDKIKETITGIAVEQELADNKTFNSLCDTLSTYCSKTDKYASYIVKDKNALQEYKKELKELQAKAEPTSDDRKKIAKLNESIGKCTTNIAKYQKSLIELIESDASDSMRSTIENIEKYITNQATGQDKNPFKNYFNAQNKKLHFGGDALKASQVYESKIISTYIKATGTIIRTLIEMCETSSNEDYINNLKEEAETISNTSKKVLEFYTSIANEEQNSANKYYENDGTVTSIERIGKAEIKNLRLYANGDYAQPDMLRALNNYKDIFPTMSTDEKLNKYFDKYMEKINWIIKNEYKDFGKYTLREFLNSKGLNVPDDAKYLIAGKMYKWGYMGYYTKIPVYELDKAINTYKSDEDGLTIAVYFHAINSNELCYFIEKSSGSSKEEGGADLIIDGYVTHYSKIDDAWNEAVTSVQGKNITLKLKEDWNAYVNADGYTYFGTGNGFKNGAIYDNGMHIGKTKLTLDLNGYTIDRKLNAPREDGSVIIAYGGDFTITDSSGTNMGTITGGNTTGNGGGIQQLNYSITVENCKITNNYAEGNGGGVSVEYHNVSGMYYGNSRFYNVEITNNKSKQLGGGISTKLNGETEITLGKRVIIKNNYYTNGLNNDCFLEDGYIRKVTIRIDNDKPLTSDSYIGIISNTNDKWLRITEKGNSSYVNNFFYNYNSNSKYKIVAQGKGNSQYLEIQKN